MTAVPRAQRAFELCLGVILVIAVWEVIGRSGLVGDGALPAPSAIARAISADWSAYPAHIAPTVSAAAQGFVWGNLIAIACTVVFVLLPTAEKVARGLSVTLYCVPIAVVAPILGIAFTGATPKVILAAMSVVFTTVVATLVSMRNVPAGSLDVIRSSGGGRVRRFALVQARSGLPGLLTGLQIAAPAALLGAILGDFLGGERGIGIYLTGVIASGSASRLWAISVVTAAVCATAYAVFGLLKRFALASSEDIAVADLAPPVTGGTPKGPVRHAVEQSLTALAGAVLVLGLWWYFVWWTGLPAIVVNSPWDVWTDLTSAASAGEDRAILRDALAQSLPPAGFGVAVGLIAALVLAVLSSLAPRLTSSVLPFAFLTQTLPLVAFAPLIALVVGRGQATIILVTVLVTFFPAFVAILQGLNEAPRGPAQVLHSVAAGRIAMLRMYTVPQAMPYLLAAGRLAIPRALLGVIVAEQLVTGTGVGGLLSRSRGFLDYSMMWSIAAVSVLVSVVAYAAATTLENRVLARWST